MILTYALTVVVGFLWALRIIAERKITIKRSPLDLFLLLFLASQIISTVLSIDVHTSIFGYYSRFNGGLLSIVCYTFLYFAFTSNISKISLKRILRFTLISAFLVSMYGILERMGIDKDYWVQDVQNRVFSTLGQPNWLATYVDGLLPVSLSLGLIAFITNEEKRSRWISALPYAILSIVFYTTLLFTQSRSGFIGLWVGLLFFFIVILFLRLRIQKDSIAPFFFVRKFVFPALFILALLTFVFGTPFSQLEGITYPGIQKRFSTEQAPQEAKVTGPALETGGTESGEIRKIVWKGALDIAKAYPFFGSGVETFAYSYYKFRPVEHNFVSEWDFLYNKAHNEYLNYLATTGIVGLGTYLALLGVFCIGTLAYLWRAQKDIRQKTLAHKAKTLNPETTDLLAKAFFTTGVLAGLFGIYISNFFGFSVVIINIFIFIFPAFVYVYTEKLSDTFEFVFFKKAKPTFGFPSWAGIALSAFIMVYLLSTIARWWVADKDFALGKNYDKVGEFSSAYPLLLSAIQGNPSEPLFQDEASINAAGLALTADEQKESTLSGQLIDQAIEWSDSTIRISPNNPNFYRTRVRVFYSLAQIDPKYYDDALTAIKKATDLAPTDPKIAYNYGLILGQSGKLDEGITQLQKAINLKPDYRDPIYALGLFYHEAALDKNGRVANQDLNNKAIQTMEVLIQRASDDAQAKQKLDEWKK